MVICGPVYHESMNSVLEKVENRTESFVEDDYKVIFCALLLFSNEALGTFSVAPLSSLMLKLPSALHHRLVHIPTIDKTTQNSSFRQQNRTHSVIVGHQRTLHRV